MYCESQPRYKGKTWTELFPGDVFPNDSKEDEHKSKGKEEEEKRERERKEERKGERKKLRCSIMTFYLTYLLARLAVDLLAQMLQIEPTKRVTVDEALKHPYVSIWYDPLEADAVSTQYI